MIPDFDSSNPSLADLAPAEQIPATPEIMRRSVFKYIEMGYNQKRRHNNISPMAFEFKISLNNPSLVNG
jgi:hypothetical protein